MKSAKEFLWQDIITALGDNYVSSNINPLTPAPVGCLWTTDSRSGLAHQWFICLRGERFNAHDFIEEARAKGAAGFVVEQEFSHRLNPNDLQIVVYDTLKALQSIAQAWLQFLSCDYVIALTGSVGKTTAKELIYTLLRQKYDDHVVATQGSFNNEVGVPLSILQAHESTRALILEFGARHLHDIGFLTQKYPPNISLCLNVRPVHLSEFGCYENILETKSEIYFYATPDAHIVAPIEQDDLWQKAQQAQRPLISFGVTKQADVAVLSTRWDEKNLATICNVKILDDYFKIEFPHYYHEALAFNLAASLAVAHLCGLSDEQMMCAFQNFTPPAGRFNMMHTEKFIIIDDSYNASPDSMIAGIKTTQKLFSQQKKILILGDMFELGELAEKAHQQLGNHIPDMIDFERILTIGPLSYFVYEALKNRGIAEHKMAHCYQLNDAKKILQQWPLENRVIFIKASHGMKLGELVSFLKQGCKG